MTQQWQWPRRQAAGGSGPAPQPQRGMSGPSPAPRPSGPPPPSRVTEIRPGATADPAAGALSDLNDDIKFRVHRRLIQELETTRLDRMPAAEAREAVDAAARQILQQEAPGVFGLARDELIAAIVDEVLGLGPIEPLLRDPTITEVMVNGPDVIFYERDGKVHRSQVRFRDNS